MIESHGPLLDAAVKPLADNPELKLAALGLLRESLRVSPEVAEAMKARWERVDTRSKPWIAKWLLLAVLLALSAWVWAVAVRQGLTYWRLNRISNLHFPTAHVFASARQDLEKCVTRDLTERERMLLFGDLSARTEVDALRALWASEPENPAYYMEFAWAHMWSHTSLPSDFVETAGRLCPENSWPLYFAAASPPYNFGSKEKHGFRDEVAGKPRVWHIRDQADLDRRIALISQASSLPGFDSYQSELLACRLSLLPMDDAFEVLTAIQVLEGGTSRGFPRRIFDPLAMKAQQLAEQGDKVGFQRLMGNFETLQERILADRVNGVSEEIQMKRAIRMLYVDLRSAADKLGLSGEFERLSSTIGRFESTNGIEIEQGMDDPGNHCSLLLDGVDENSLFESSWTEGDLKPGRLADHEMLSRACCLAAWLLLGVASIAAVLFRFRLSALLRRLSDRVAALLDAKDMAWILGTGLGFPYVYLMVINRLTPLGGRDWGVMPLKGILPGAQFLGMVLLMWMLPVWLIRWRLGKRTKGWCIGVGGFDWLMRCILCMVLFIPVVGWFGTHREVAFYGIPILFSMLAYSLSWILISVYRALVGRDSLEMLVCGVIARKLGTVYAAAILLMAAACFVHRSQECRWFRQDRTVRLDPAISTTSLYEWRTAANLRQHLRNILQP